MDQDILHFDYRLNLLNKNGLGAITISQVSSSDHPHSPLLTRWLAKSGAQEVKCIHPEMNL